MDIPFGLCMQALRFYGVGSPPLQRAMGWIETQAGLKKENSSALSIRRREGCRDHGSSGRICAERLFRSSASS
jgi:hypothetical protein